MPIDLCDSDDDDDTGRRNKNRKRVPLHRVSNNGIVEILECDDDKEEQQAKPKTKTDAEGIIEILDDDDDDEEYDDDRKPAAKKRKSNSATNGITNATVSLGDSRSSRSEELEVELVEAPPVSAVAARMEKESNFSGSALSASEECMVIGRTGKNSLSDFPHSREYCSEHPINDDPKKSCVLCYCYVCDIPASECTEWTKHCKARYQDPKWRRERERRKQNPTTASTTPATNQAHRHAPNVVSPWQQTLQPFAEPISMEEIQGFRRQPTLREYSDDALLQEVTRVHPVEKNPPPTFVTDLKHYQKQSLAFMYDVETASKANLDPTKGFRGGWLASEVGMGKTAVALALVETNPYPFMSAIPNRRKLVRHLDKYLFNAQPWCVGGCPPEKKIKLKTTVIRTSVSLMGQWQEECKKHAPNLVVKRYHPTSENSRMDKKDLLQWNKTKALAKDLAEADVIITSATSKKNVQFEQLFEFHREIVDESHLMGSVSLKRDYVGVSKTRWCITATPFGGNGLRAQNDSFLNWTSGNRFRECNHLSPKEQFYFKLRELKKVMIRHTKSQQINGSAALVLPESTTDVLFVHMNEKERKMYKKQLRRCHESLTNYTAKGGVSMFPLEQTLAQLCMNNLLGDDNIREYTKIRALFSDLQQMILTEPHARVVIYSQYKRTAIALTARLKQMMTVYSFDGSTPSNKRDDAIREFQSVTPTGGNPAAFVITLRAGSVGITLTTASRVYLMEPSIDTAKEVQAAGRIHRLGQTKNVTVKKLIYKNSIEESIQLLQKELIAGRIKLTSRGFVPPAGLRILMKGTSKKRKKKTKATTATL